jgi:hypothetical protein
LDIRWNEETGSYSTFILHSSYDKVEDEAECEIKSLEDLNLLLATDAEFYKNVTTLISIGALEAYDVEVEFLMQVVFDRISGEDHKIPYGYSMAAGKFIPDRNYIYSFNEKEAATGRLALEAIKVLSRTGDWWGETLDIRHISTEWSPRTHTYVPSEDKYFLVQVTANNVYRRSCHEAVTVTFNNLAVLASSVEDIVSSAGEQLAADCGVTQNFWASCLFCERTDEVNDVIKSAVLNKMPVEVAALFPAHHLQF